MIDPSTINPFNLPSIPLEQRSQLSAFDSKKFFLGKLCKFEHRWNGTGQSLRYRSSYRCVECSNSKNEQKRYEVTEVAIQRTIELAPLIDTSKRHLGALCRRKHDWEQTGFSLRRNFNQECVECRSQRKRERTGAVPRRKGRRSGLPSNSDERRAKIKEIFLSKTEFVKQEQAIQQKLMRLLGGDKEVKTPFGQIDLLTSTHLIEIKRMEGWKEAIGQVLAYSYHYPSHQKRIHFFGEIKPSFLAQIKTVCTSLNIEVTTED